MYKSLFSAWLRYFSLYWLVGTMKAAEKDHELLSDSYFDHMDVWLHVIRTHMSAHVGKRLSDREASRKVMSFQLTCFMDICLPVGRTMKK